MEFFFYTMLAVFVANDIYHLLNRKRIARNFERRDVLAVRHLDLVYYFLKILSVMWPFIGLFTQNYHYFVCVIVLWAMKFVSYHVNKWIYAIYAISVPFLISAVYLALLISWFRC